MTSLPGMLDWFAVGIALAVIAAVWETEPRRVPRLARLAARPGLCWMLAALCFGLGAIGSPDDLFLPLYGPATHIALGLAGGLLLLPAVRIGAPGGPLRVLSLPVVVWLGTISYGIYLWHTPLLNMIYRSRAEDGHPASVVAVLALLIVTAAGAIALGAASWYLVERPSQRLASRVSARRADALTLAPLVGADRGAG